MKKQVQELKRGDVILAVGGKNVPTMVVIAVNTNVKRIVIDFWSTIDRMIKRDTVPLDLEVTIEQYDLTPAQQYADQLATAVARAIGTFSAQPNLASIGGWGDWLREASALLAIVAPPPPAPPTAEELARALDHISTRADFDRKEDTQMVTALLERARAAGML